MGVMQTEWSGSHHLQRFMPLELEVYANIYSRTKKILKKMIIILMKRISIKGKKNKREKII